MKETTDAGRIELIGVGKDYGSIRVVRDIDLVIGEGEFVSLLGPSGSGKTTTLMMIAGFAANDHGTIRLGARDITAVPPRERGFGMVFQNYALFPHLTVAQNVEFPLKARKMPTSDRRERVRWALETVKLEDFADRKPRQLSGGQQQRVALARAIVYHPKVILMDEPLGALDKNLRFHMQTEIKDIQRRLGMTVVYVTHDQEEAMNMSDRIAIMRDGVIAQVGSAERVYQAPQSPFVARFLGEANLLPVTMSRSSVTLGSGAAIACDGSGDAPAVGPAMLFVRPEKLRVAPDDPRAFDNALPVTVTRVSHLGNIIRYGFETAGLGLIADVQNIGGGAAHAVGEALTLCWNRGDCRLLPAGEGVPKTEPVR